MKHELKIKQSYLDNLKLGTKTAEIRYNDRDYQVGDVLKFYDKELLEYANFRINHIHSGLGVADGYVVLSISKLS